MIFCMNEAGREDFSICQQNLIEEDVDVDEDQVTVHYRCNVCGRRWFGVYKFDEFQDVDGEPLEV